MVGMKIALVNPNIVSQKDDFSGSGIPYMPSELAYLAAYLKAEGHTVNVVDAFGEAPTLVRKAQNQFIQGLSSDAVVERIPAGIEAVGLYAHLTVSHSVSLEIIRKLRARFCSLPIMVLENTSKVNGYSLRRVYQDFFAAGADFTVLGFLEKRTAALLKVLLEKNRVFPVLNGVIRRDRPDDFCPPVDDNADLDELPFPQWDLFPIENYWKIGYAHAPLTGKKYLPLITSRGCPFNCGFCVAPEINGRKWKARSAENVVDEISYFKHRFGVSEFHIEDLNPTLDKQRMIGISRLLIERKLDIKWKIAQGTKLETLDEEVIGWMARAGCNYISISPESGSDEILRLMDKPVNVEYARKIVRSMAGRGIYSQACFVIGYPGEAKAHLDKTTALAKKLAFDGIDEIALFIITPMPGAKIYAQFSGRMLKLDQLTFSPNWREDYAFLSRYRFFVYLQYIGVKICRHPFRALGYLWSLATGRYRTKVEMTIARKVKVFFWSITSQLVKE